MTQNAVVAAILKATVAGSSPYRSLIPKSCATVSRDAPRLLQEDTSCMFLLYVVTPVLLLVCQPRTDAVLALPSDLVVTQIAQPKRKAPTCQATLSCA